MTRFVVDCGVVLRIAEEGLDLPDGHELLAPTLLRSQTLSVLHEQAQRGELPPDMALARLDEITRMITKLPIRLLGDAVLRRNAWRLADQLGWGDTYTAEYVALTKLQADAFVTLDAELARRLDGIVAVAGIDALRRG
jgi:predicted nucleic acid-binding protein